MAAAQVAGQPGAEWDEGQCTAALALLEQLQAQVNSRSYFPYETSNTYRSTTFG